MDGTLLGRDGSLFRDADGAFTMLAARALEACARAEVEVVPYSGRRRSTLLHDARLLGLRSYIFEAGVGLVLDGEGQWGAEEVDDGAANALLLERYAGRLEMYDPWQLGRESSRLYLGHGVDAAEADELLANAGHGHFRLIDNGAMRASGGAGRAPPVTPRAPSRAAAVARHMRARAYAPEECIAGRGLAGGP